MKKKKTSRLPSIKKDIQAFINEEEAQISKKDAITLGLSLVVLGSVLADQAAAHSSFFSNDGTSGKHHSENSETFNLPEHESYFDNSATRGRHHSDHNIYYDHNDHSDHSDGGSCYSDGGSCYSDGGSCYSDSTPSCHYDHASYFEGHAQDSGHFVGSISSGYHFAHEFHISG